MQSLLKINEGDVLMTGLFPSLPKNQMALWREGENVLFFDSRIEKAPGTTFEATADTDILAFAQALVDNQERVYYGTAGKLYRWAQGIQQQIGSGFASQDWSLEPYGDWLVATNDVSVPHVWKNAGVAVPLGGVSAVFNRCKLIKKMENHLIALNLDTDGKAIAWSSRSAPEVWAPTSANTAGDFTIRDLDSDIIAAEFMGDVLGIYSGNSYCTLTYVGGSFVFGVKKRLEGIGAIGKDSIVAVSNEHFGLGPNGVFRNNGISYAYIDTPAIKRWMRANANPNLLSRARGFHHLNKTLVVWSVICLDGLRRSIAYNYSNQSWTILKINATAWDEPAVIGGVQVGRPVVAIGASWGFYGSSPDVGGVALPASIKTNALAAGTTDRWKLWNMLRVDVERNGIEGQYGGLEIRFGFGETPSADDDWTAWEPLEYENWIDREAIFMAFEVRSTIAGLTWAITGLEIFGTGGGYQR